MSTQPSHTQQSASGLGSRTSPPALTGRQWSWAVALGVLYTLGTAWGVRHVELVTGRYITSGVPPIPAVAALMILVPWAVVLRRLPQPFPRLALERRQILIIFAMLSITTVLNGQYLIRAFLPHLGILRYWPTHGSSTLIRWAEYWPDWYAPTDAEAWRQYFEGSRGAGVPWHLWLVPLFRWMLFLVAVFILATSLVGLVRRQWIHHERLSFPLLYLPLAYTADDSRGIFGGRPLFRHPLLWLGVGFTAVFNGINIAHALNPSIPAPGFYFLFSGMFTEPALKPFNTVSLFYMLESIGFGYFVPLEISFSTWFFYLLIKLAASAGLAAGVEAPGFPFMQDQAAGAYLGVTALILFGARKHLAAVTRRAFGFARGKDTDEDRDERAALFGFLGSTAFIMGWCWVAGFSLALAALFFGVLCCFILVFSRIRAETGVPFGFVYPYALPKEMIVNAFTPRGVLDLGGPRSWVLFSGFAWLSRHHYAQELAAYTADGLKLADETRIQRRWLYGALIIALVVGLACAFWTHLDGFYALGSNLAGGGTGTGEYRALVALQEFQRMATQATTNIPRDNNRLAAQGFGALFAVFLGIVRIAWMKSPFHPLGYILATAYGDSTPSLLPLFVAWAAKSLALKAGGLPMYRQVMPLFIGLILGHYAFGGIFWPVFSLLLAPEASRSYHIYFGG
jgi:hypothetical protein